VHFSAFMLEVHDRLHALRRAAAGDAVPALAAALAQEAALLCLDELQIDNIADAMLVARLFEAILAAGTVVVATSNWAPDALYAGGLQRDRVLPFIALIKDRLDIVALDGGLDYRRARLAGMQVYHWPLSPEAEAALERDFAVLTEGLAARPAELEVQGRIFHVARAARDVAWLSFDELCGAPRGTADYRALVQRFAVIVVAGIPLLGGERRDEARRFTLLVDLLYEAGTKLLCSAAAPPDRLFDIARDAVVNARAVSRLIEMQSAAYLARPAQENDAIVRRSLALAVERE
jgi:cell division protein ZapE